MTNDRSQHIPSDTFFFSAHLQDQRADTLTRYIDVLRQSVRLTRKRWPFVIEAAVVLPNQTHMIWTLPSEDANFSKRWRLIKSTFSRHVPAPLYRSQSQNSRGEKGIWQRRFWEHAIKNGQEFDEHMKMIKDAPVTMGLVQDTAIWPYSSFNQTRRRMRLDTSALAANALL